MPSRVSVFVLLAVVGCQQAPPPPPEPESSATDTSQAASGESAESAATRATDAEASTTSASEEGSSDQAAPNDSSESTRGDSSSSSGATESHPAPPAPSRDKGGDPTAKDGNGRGRPGASRDERRSEPVGRRFASPTDAASFAQGQLDAAKATRDPRAALETALEGWQAVNQHSNDADCRALAAKLLQEMKTRDRQAAAASAGEPLRDLPLKIN